MTKYILVGGYPYKAKDGGKAMCREATSGLKGPINILICLFARKKNEWAKLFKENVNFFKKNLPGQELVFNLAQENKFIQQIETSNLIYFSGGDTTDLVNVLNRIDGWEKKIAGKNVMGSSAGTDIFSKYNYDLEFFKISKGYGLVPVKTIVHFGAKDYEPPVGWEKAYKELEKYKEKMPIITLGEGQFEVFVIE